MGSKEPEAYTVRPVSRSGLVLSLVPLVLFVAVARAFLTDMTAAAIAGCAAFLAYRLVVVRLVVCGEHRRGVLLTRRGRFAEALAAFERSEAFFGDHRWVDRYRAPLLGCASAYSYLSMAVYNQAFCQAQLGRGEEAMQLVRELLAEDPHNTLARSLGAVLTAGRAASREAPHLPPEPGEPHID